MIHRKIYLSEVIVRTDKDLGKFFAPLSSIAQQLNQMTGLSFEPFGFAIDTTMSTVRPSPFKFEREVQKTFSQNRYYSAAPLRTSDHLELLKKMEALL